MNKTQFRIAQRLVYSEVQWLYELKYVGGALIDFIYHLSPNSFLERATVEWILRPRNWVALRFTHRQWNPKIEVSIDTDPGLPNIEQDIVIRPGRYRWRKFTVTNVTQLAASYRILSATYQTNSQVASISRSPTSTASTQKAYEYTQIVPSS